MTDQSGIGEVLSKVIAERDAALARAKELEARVSDAVSVIQEREAESRKFAQECDRLEDRLAAMTALLRKLKPFVQYYDRREGYHSPPLWRVAAIDAALEAAGEVSDG